MYNLNTSPDIVQNLTLPRVSCLLEGSLYWINLIMEEVIDIEMY